MPRGKGFGSVIPIIKEELVNGSLKKKTTGYRIRYTGPDRQKYREAGFTSKQQARRRLAVIQTEIGSRTWESPQEIAKQEANKPMTVSEYADVFMVRPGRKGTTNDEYWTYLKKFIIPAFGDLPLPEVTPLMVGQWHAKLSPDHPTYRARIYGFMRTLMLDAERNNLIDKSPCRIKGAGNVERQSETILPTETEVLLAIAFMPKRLQLATVLTATYGLRSGEVRALRRSDVDLKKKVIHIRQNLTRYKAEGDTQSHEHFGTPKTRTGIRDLAIKDDLIPYIQSHLDTYSAKGEEGLLFPNEEGNPYTLQRLNDFWLEARKSAGCPKLRWHDMRHYAASVAHVVAGAEEYEVMAMLGQKDSKVVRKYFDMMEGRMQAIANNIPSLVPGSTLGA